MIAAANPQVLGGLHGGLAIASTMFDSLFVAYTWAFHLDDEEPGLTITVVLAPRSPVVCLSS